MRLEIDTPYNVYNFECFQSCVELSLHAQWFTHFSQASISILLYRFAVLFFYGIQRTIKMVYIRASVRSSNRIIARFAVDRFSISVCIFCIYVELYRNSSKSNWIVELCDLSHKFGSEKWNDQLSWAHCFTGRMHINHLDIG